ncbi:hypothetical protein DOY81_012665 [Sarcophaga bullata]|nr:hypothetical protein DOY81_012665 [Sarcophaga bullata]
MRELNLLADIAQHLSPYQLDLPECNNPPQSSLSSPPPTPIPLPSPTSSIEPSINTLENSTENKDADSKGKAIVTEQLIIQSFDDIIEKSQQIDKNEELQPQQSPQNAKENLQQEDIHDYAHEPKLNVAAIFNSSPESLMKDQNQQQNNPPVKDADVNPSNNKTNSTSLEQILEESIKSVTSPFNPNNECNTSKTTQPQPQNESKIPLLISNVESLNHLQSNSLTGNIGSKSDGNGDSDAAKNSKQNLNERKSNQIDSENVFFMNKSTNETKDVTEENASDNTTSRLISTVESSLICGDLSNISTDMGMTNNNPVTTLMNADLSDISLESELSKHLPEIAEPSPVVTDMSDNSNESDVSKGFVINSTHHSTSGALESNDIPVMSLPDLPLVMPPIPPPPPLPPSQQTSISMLSSTTPQLDNDYNPLDATLNTPIKQPSLPTGDVCSAESRGDLVTPLKFSLQTELESDNSPLKSTLEPESDSNVTKFLDLILNKTVTDAESETRDKIIKELNALTSDTSATETVESIQKDDIEVDSQILHSNATEDDAGAEKNKNKVQNHGEEIKFLDAATDKLSKDEKVSKEKCNDVSMKDDSQNSFEENSEINHKQLDKPTHGDESVKKDTERSVERNEKQKQAHKKDILIPEIPEISPPKVNSIKESTTTTTTTTASINTELISTTTSSSETSNAKLKISPVKQTFNIKCRVRLKRLNITDHCKRNKKETWMAIPITKPDESETASNDPTNCDNSKNDATTLLRKSLV